MLSSVIVALSAAIVMFAFTWYAMKHVAAWCGERLKRRKATNQQEVSELADELGLGRNGQHK